MAETRYPQPHSCDYCSKLLVDLWKPSQLEDRIKRIFTELTSRDNVDKEVNLEIIPQRLTAAELLEGASVGCQFLESLLYDKDHIKEPEAMTGHTNRSHELHGSGRKFTSSDQAILLLQDPRTRVVLELRYFRVQVQRGLKWFRYLREISLLLENPATVYHIMPNYKPLYIHSIHGHPAERCIGRTMPNYEPGSNATAQQTKRWLQDCDSYHSCRNLAFEERPTRVLRLQRLESGLSVAFLVSGTTVDRFVALSYVWGEGSQLSTRLTKSRINKAEGGVLSNLLPKTIQDAITVTLDLGLQFLWVDALCIVQDDDDDKARELPKMAAIYGGAYLTISAAVASNCDQGFLHSRTKLASKDLWTRINFRSPDDVYDHIFIPHQVEPIPLSSEPINSRAWTLQEHLLSPRLLIYGSRQLRWSCRAKSLVDGGELMSRSINRTVNDGTLLSGLHFPKHDTNSLWGSTLRAIGVDEKFQESEIISSWNSIVKTYTSRGLSEPSDKLKAISAIAQNFSKNVKDEYLAGLWRRDLIHGLMWRVQSPLRDHPPIYRAPSWSWASVDDAVQTYKSMSYADIVFPWAVTVLSCRVETASHLSPFVDVKSGFIQLRAKIRGGIGISNNWILYDKMTRLWYPVMMSPDAFGPAYMEMSVWCLELRRWAWHSDQGLMCVVGLVLQETDQAGVFKRLGVYRDIDRDSMSEQWDRWEMSFCWGEVTII